MCKSFRYAPTLNETTNWKTYINKEAGWSIKYPANWHIYDKGFRYKDPDDDTIKWLKTYKDVFFSDKPFPEFIPEGTEYPFEGVIIRLDPNQLPLLERSINVNSEVATKKASKTIYDSRNELESPPAYRSINIIYLVDYSTGELPVLSIHLSAINNYEQYNKIFDQMIKDFKFTR